jgi:hypothetical protein
MVSDQAQGEQVEQTGSPARRARGARESRKPTCPPGQVPRLVMRLLRPSSCAIHWPPAPPRYCEEACIRGPQKRIEGVAESKIQCLPRTIPVAAMHQAPASAEPVRLRGNRVMRDADSRAAHGRQQPLHVGMAVARIQRSHSHGAEVAQRVFGALFPRVAHPEAAHPWHWIRRSARRQEHSRPSAAKARVTRACAARPRPAGAARGRRRRPAAAATLPGAQRPRCSVPPSRSQSRGKPAAPAAAR